MEYKKYENLLHSLAWKYSRVYGADVDDLLSCAHIGYMKAVQTFDPERKCKFSTHLTHKVKGEIRKTLQPRAGTLAPDLRAELSDQISDGKSDVFRQALFLESLENLGAEAKTVVAIIFESPIELFDWTANVVKITCSNLREFLRNRGWTSEKIDSAFKEIRTMLRKLNAS